MTEPADFIILPILFQAESFQHNIAKAGNYIDRDHLVTFYQQATAVFFAGLPNHLSLCSGAFRQPSQA